MAWLLANWRLVAVLALVAALGVQTFRLQDLELEYEQLGNEYRVFRLGVDAAGREARASAQAKNAHNEGIRKELEHEIRRQQEGRDRERAERSDRFGALYGKYMGLLNADPGGGRVPEAGDGAGAPVHTGRDICFDRQLFADGIRRELGALYSEVESLARRGEDGLDDRMLWGRWARLVDVCPKP